MTTPYLVALCPTFRRPDCLRNALACWLAQDYPDDRRELLILDDAGQWPSQAGHRWKLLAVRPRYESLPAKYNALATLAPHADAYVLWEDDDVYLPWHLSAHAHTLSGEDARDFSRPTQVWSNYGTIGTAIHQEPALGRFHGSWAFRRDAFERVGRYRETRQLNFDQELGGRLEALHNSGDPCAHPRGPSYVYRWGNAYYNGQAWGDDYHETVAWMGDPRPQTTLAAAMDAETERIYRELRA